MEKLKLKEKFSQFIEAQSDTYSTEDFEESKRALKGGKKKKISRGSIIRDSYSNYISSVRSKEYNQPL